MPSRRAARIKSRAAPICSQKSGHAASETQRDFAASKKSKKSDFAAKATNDADEKYNTRDFTAEVTSGADVKFCAHTLMASEKFCARDFAAYDASKKSRATNLSVQSASGKFCANEQNEQNWYFEERNLVVFDKTRRWLDLYFSGLGPGFTPALNPAG